MGDEEARLVNGIAARMSVEISVDLSVARLGKVLAKGALKPSL
jgi:hypothetical protein